MNLTEQFIKMIDEMQEALKFEWQGGAFQWADETFDNAWTHAVDRFEAAINLAVKTNDAELFNLELKFYKSKTLDLFDRYKKLNTKADIDTYLEQLKFNIK
jgi:hypothetical protein